MEDKPVTVYLLMILSVKHESNGSKTSKTDTTYLTDIVIS